MLRGKVVLIDFWTYSCINCLRSIPYVRAWHERYRGDGLVVIGVHAPEFAFERDLGNVRGAVADLGIPYPVALDNDFALWRAFHNRFWPAHYFIDHLGRVRYHHFGEGDYERSERVIRQLLAEAGRAPRRRHGAGRDPGRRRAGGARDPALARDLSRLWPRGRISPRRAAWSMTGQRLSRRADGAQPMVADRQLDGAAAEFAAQPRGRQDRLPLPCARPPPRPRQRRAAGRASASPSTAGPRARRRGSIVDARGEGRVTGQRLYQLVRQRGEVGERLFEIEFLDPGVEAFAFTFG